MKRILFITANDWFATGGSEELWTETALRCAEKGFDVGICVRKWDPLPTRLAALDKKPNVVFFYKQPPAYTPTEQLYNKFTPSRFKKIAREFPYKQAIVDWKPHLVVISQGHNRDGLEMMLHCGKNGLKYTTISQSVYEGIWPEDEILDNLDAGYANAAMNYFVSEANQRVTELQVGRDIPNKKVIRNPFNVPYDNNLDYPAGEPLSLACVARYELYAKGQDVVLEALNDEKWKNRNIRLNFYGKGKNEQGIKNLIRYFGLEDVARVNAHTPTIEIWKTNHALLLPSRYEGLPLSLVEAMLCARMGIVTNVSGNKEVILDNVNGFVAEAPKAEYVDAALERAWQRRGEWKEIGLAAKAHIRSLVGKDPIEDFVEELSNRIGPISI
jgi:glycosyltransferase involved in cell wall biosynthesis